MDSFPDYSSQGSNKESTLQGSDIEVKNQGSTVTLEKEHYPSFSTDAILVQDGSFGWDKDKEPLLQSINLTVPREKFTMLVGPVGCGKSTLLKALLSEVPTINGTIQVSASQVAYCDQTPWHMNGTVQESIVAVSDYDAQWYTTVIDACALDEDLRQLAQGDQTVIGSSGIALSGGQSQRIVSGQDILQVTCRITDSLHKALARAVYARKEIVILDDVLSGLDLDTENRVFHNLLGRDGLLRKYHATVLIASSSGELNYILR